MTHNNAIKNSELLEKIELGTISIDDIERISEDSMAALTKKGYEVNGHNVYFVDFKGYFGYSVLVFKRGHHIYFANDYQLHHKGMDRKELTKYYWKKVNRILFTEDQLLYDPVISYDDYKLKSDYIHNLFAQQWDHESFFFIGTDKEREEKRLYIEKNFPYECNVTFAYYNDIYIAEKAKQLDKAVLDSYNDLQRNNNEVFRDMIRKELFNHEAGYTMDFTDALGALGLRYSKLSGERQKIVREELNYVINHTC